MPHKYWYCGTFDFKKVSKTRFYYMSKFIQVFYQHMGKFFLLFLSKTSILYEKALKLPAESRFFPQETLTSRPAYNKP